LGVEAPVFEQGVIVGQRYQVQRLVGRGGMGEVYQARDLTLGGFVALKTAAASVCDEDGAGRLLRSELRHARLVRHPNVRRVYGLGEHQSERWPVRFLCMQYIAGESLGRRLRRTALEFEHARTIARQVLLGLRATHEADVIHLDLKSDNIMLTSDEARVVITDFALAFRRSSAHAASVGPGRVGTPGYMAPELFDRRAAGAEADVFSFGVVLFEMLTGRLPFEPTGSRWPRWRVSQVRGLSSAGDVELPPDMLEFVDRCLRVDPRERFSDASAALAAFDQVLVTSGRIAPTAPAAR
jgi:serine/threonine protein kinase